MAERLNIHLQKSTKDKLEKFKQMRGNVSVTSLHFAIFTAALLTAEMLYQGIYIVQSLTMAYCTCPNKHGNVNTVVLFTTF